MNISSCSSRDLKSFVARTLQENCTAPWFDMWHLHLPRQYDGRRQEREERIEAALYGLDLLSTGTVNFPFPTQAWVLLVGKRTIDESLYIHSENPNGTPFPYPFEGVEWSSDAPSYLHDLRILRYLCNLRLGRFDDTTWFLAPRKVIASLAK